MKRFTIEDVGEMSEGQLFDRKSAKIKPKDILKHIIAFANADGGALAIGIEDDGVFPEPLIRLRIHWKITG